MRIFRNSGCSYFAAFPGASDSFTKQPYKVRLAIWLLLKIANGNLASPLKVSMRHFHSTGNGWQIARPVDLFGGFRVVGHDFREVVQYANVNPQITNLCLVMVRPDKPVHEA